VEREGVEGKGKGKIVALRSNTRSNVEVAKLPTFNGNATKVSGFIMACRLYIRIRMINTFVEEQVQWVLLYV